MKETELYGPIKAFLEGQGYEVKAEVATADVVACRGEGEVVIVELKIRFSLALVHQGIARQAVTDVVYIAAPRGKGRPFMASLANMKKLCRKLGLGLLTVRMGDRLVEVHCDPAPYRPRRSTAGRERLLREFSRLEGDPNTGGTRGAVVTAYRQDSMRCATYLAGAGPCKGAIVARETGITRATRMMADNHYGWFRKVSTGVYEVTDQGRNAASCA